MKWAALGVGALVALTDCAPPVPLEPTPAAGVVQAPSPVATSVVVVQTVAPLGPGIPAVVVRALASPRPVAVPLSVLAGRSGADVRVALDRLLQEQMLLTSLELDAVSNARLDELLGVSGALDQNALALAEVVGAIKGQPTAEALLSGWRAHNAALIQYAQGQPAAANLDLARLGATIAEQLALGDFSATQADDLMRTRLQAQHSLADASDRRDQLELIRLVRAAAASSDDLGRPLAAAMAAKAPSLAPPPTAGPDVDVRLGLNRLLVEHVYLSGAAVEASAGGRALDLAVRLAAANDSADELGQQLAAVWGAELGTAVADRLRAETAVLVSLAAGGNRSQAAVDLDQSRSEVDRLLSSANPLLPKGLLNQQLRPSDQPLLAATDAFAARDFLTAYARLHEAARQVQKPADTLALSIVDRFPGRYLVRPTPESPG